MFVCVYTDGFNGEMRLPRLTNDLDQLNKLDLAWEINREDPNKEIGSRDSQSKYSYGRALDGNSFVSVEKHIAVASQIFKRIYSCQIIQ